jgi:hypothetical protein
MITLNKTKKPSPIKMCTITQRSSGIGFGWPKKLKNGSGGMVFGSWNTEFWTKLKVHGTWLH